MKKPALLLTLCFIGLMTFAQPYTWTAIAPGPWTTPGIWMNVDGSPNSYPQTTDDIVIIKNTMGPVIANAFPGITVKSITIDNDMGLSASLLISTPFSLSTTEDFILQGDGSSPDNSSLIIGGGNLTIGGNLIVYGSIGLSGNSTISVGGFYQHNTGTVSMSDQFTLNVSTEGAIPSNVDKNNFFIGSAANYIFLDGTVNFTLNLLNGNLGTKEEIYLEAATVTDNSTGGYLITTISNTDNIDNSFSIKTDLNLGEVKINIGATKTITFDNLTDPPTQDVNFKALNMISGKFEMVSGSLLTIDPATTYF